MVVHSSTARRNTEQNDLVISGLQYKMTMVAAKSAAVHSNSTVQKWSSSPQGDLPIMAEPDSDRLRDFKIPTVAGAQAASLIVAINTI